MRACSVIAALVLASALAACSSDTAGSGTGRYGASVSAQPSASGSATAPSSAAVPSSKAPRTSASPTTSPVPDKPLRTKAVTAGGTGTTYVIKVWAEQNVKDCAAHAYGDPVIHYLQTHPCFGLGQLLATTTVNGREVGFAQRSIGFTGGEPASYRAADNFAKLVAKDGTGNLNDLMREGYRLPSGPTSVPFPNAFSALGQDNNVTIVEAWYLKGATPDNDRALEKMAQDIFLQY
jgi:hypothetical protein